MKTGDLLARLEAVEPLRLQAIELVMELTPVMASTEVVALNAGEGDLIDPIDAAMRDLRHQADETEKLVKRCRHLQPVPSKTPPTGF